MQKFRFKANSKRDHGAVVGVIELAIMADSLDEAEQKVRDSLPGFDWEQWNSMYGVEVVENGS